MSITTTKKVNAARAWVVASETAGVMKASEMLFEAGGKKLLSEGVQSFVRESAEGAGRLLVTKSAPELLAKAALKSTSRTAIEQTVGAVKSLAPAAAQTAVKQLVKGIGRATLFGGAVDAVVGSVEAGYMYKKGELSKRQAAVHAAKQTATGAAASAAGATALAAVVAFTGPIGWGAALLIVGGVSIGTKLGLSAVVD